MPSVRSNLRARLQRGETIVAPGAYDPLSARVVQALGFAVYTGGYMTGAHEYYRAVINADRTG